MSQVTPLRGVVVAPLRSEDVPQHVPKGKNNPVLAPFAGAKQKNKETHFISRFPYLQY